PACTEDIAILPHAQLPLLAIPTRRWVVVSSFNSWRPTNILVVPQLQLHRLRGHLIYEACAATIDLTPEPLRKLTGRVHIPLDYRYQVEVFLLHLQEPLSRSGPPVPPQQLVSLKLQSVHLFHRGHALFPTDSGAEVRKRYRIMRAVIP